MRAGDTDLTPGRGAIGAIGVVSPTMEIKPFRKQHLDDVVRVFVRAYEGWTPAEARAYLEKFHSFEPESCLVALAGGQIVGAILGYSFPRRKELILFIQELFVDPDHRKAGIGRRLVEALRKSFVDNPKVNITPLVKADTTVLSFYNSLGFDSDQLITFYDG